MDTLGLPRQIGKERLRRREVRVLIEEVVLGNPHVLEARRVCFLRQRDVVHERDVLVIGVLRDARVGDVPLQEKTEFHLVGSSRTWAKAYAGGRSPVKNTF